MIKKSVYKIPEGKLVKIQLEVKQQRIEKIKITGDFFMYPEESLEELEKDLIGCRTNNETLTKRINNFWKIHKVDCFGITSEGVATAILLAK